MRHLAVTFYAEINQLILVKIEPVVLRLDFDFIPRYHSIPQKTFRQVPSLRTRIMHAFVFWMKMIRRAMIRNQ